MNEKHMQYILAVLKEGSFTAAAKRLYVSQPSLSQAVKAAEASLGTAIFDRSTEPVSLTPAGELYVNTASQILDLSANLKKQVEELSREESGSLRLGISVQRAMELLPLLYPKFKKQFPHVALELMEQGSALLEQTVLEGTVDIALLTTFPRHEGLVYELLKEEHLVLLVNKDCSLASRIPPGTPIDIREAANEEFICSRRGHSVRAILNSLFLERGIAPKLALETISIEVGKHMVAAAPLVMACPDSYVDADHGSDVPYKIYPIQGVTRPRHFYACYRKELYLTKYMHGFLDCLRELVQE